MAVPTVLTDEDGRIEAILRYGLDDGAKDPVGDRIVRVLRHVYDAPLAAVTVLTGRTQLLRSESGFGCASTPRSAAFCNATIRSYDPFSVPDAAADPLLARNPLVIGPPHLRAYLGVPITLGKGYNIGALCVLDRVPRPDFTAEATGPLHDLAAVLVQVLDLRMLSRTDALTGLANRRHFLEELSREIGRARRRGRPVSVAMLDIDHFKRVNDSHGHAAGDAVLQEVALRLRGALREQDLLGRMGGEEFGIILPETTHEQVLKVARRLREAVAGRSFVAGAAPELSLSVSIGVATADGTATSPEQLLEQSDTALYAAKAGGRDCIRPADVPPGSGTLRAAG